MQQDGGATAAAGGAGVEDATAAAGSAGADGRSDAAGSSRSPIRRLYNGVMRAAEGPRAMKWLAAVSFAESSFFPIPPDAMLVPMILAQPKRAWTIAAVCSIASVVGGFFGYAIGFYLFQSIGQPIVDLYGYQAAFAKYQAEFQHWGLWIILIKGLTPIPYKIVTIASGVAHFDLLVFGAASLVTRSARFFLVAALLRLFGERIRVFIEKYLTWVTTAFVVLVLGGFAALRYL